MNFDMFTVKAGTQISLIKKEFNKHFPYLKLEFFKTKPSLQSENFKKDILLVDFKLYKSDSELAIVPEMPVATLEQQFFEKFGVWAQVFRKSGQSWLETTMTDDWTLARQNQEGEELSLLKRDR